MLAEKAEYPVKMMARLLEDGDCDAMSDVHAL